MKTFACQSCGRTLGTTDGEVLLLGSTEAVICLERVTTLFCMSCGTERVWRPVMQREQQRGCCRRLVSENLSKPLLH